MLALAMQREYGVEANTTLLSFVKYNENNLMKPVMCLSFQSEKETSDRNYAIGYYLKEKKVSPCAPLIFQPIHINYLGEDQIFREKKCVSSLM